MRRSLLMTAAMLALCTHHVAAQWALQDSHTTASLRGIHYVGDGVAWASGTGGTVLRTLDMGRTWTTCAVPPDAEKLDFRGVQAFDAKTAIVMSSGKGGLSRLYRTTDGCVTWKQTFTNPDKDGFWDCLQFETEVWGKSSGLSQRQATQHHGFLLGDPVNGKFVLFETRDSGQTWRRWRDDDIERPATAGTQEAAFAASNSSLLSPGFHRDFAFVTGGASGSKLWLEEEHLVSDKKLWVGFKTFPLPLAASASGGAFGVAARYTPYPHYSVEFMVVGGDYLHPEATVETAVFLSDLDKSKPSIGAPLIPPSGYRSAVAYDPKTRDWITVGTNGTDISTDDGYHWRPLKPGTDEAPDADKNWNALSLPFVIGPKGRIGVLREDVLKPVGAGK